LALILNIDTATEHASVCLSDDQKVLGIEKSFEQKNHASFIQSAIKRLFENVHQKISEADAIAVTAGPGSYTGLRVGLASAKGLCYALDKPLILLNTLEVMAQAAIKETDNSQRSGSKILFCPMIDARRMEVFTALYDEKLQLVLMPAAIILYKETFKEYLDEQRIMFSGSGSDKFKKIIHHQNAVFSEVQHSAADMIALSGKYFSRKQFADLAYSEPFYLKEFFTPSINRYDKKF
jgi:tRNA threonylcarbamoyladenosine biosynthesis protein TsaB